MNRQTLKDKRGLALIETALVLGILVLLTFGVMEYGWLFFRMQQVSNVARECARVAVRPSSSDADVQATADQLMGDWGMGGSGYNVGISPGGVDTQPVGTEIEITITVPYGNLELMGLNIFPLPGNLIGQATMAREGP